MFGVSFTELVIIALVVLVLLGPDKLPEAARAFGKFMGIVKRNSDALRREFYNTVYTPVEDLKNRADLAARDLVSLATKNPEEMNCEEKVLWQKKQEEETKQKLEAETKIETPDEQNKTQIK
jgi:sec-independent protein translocase protein TatB